MRWTDDGGWNEPADWRDVAWGIVTAVLLIVGVAFIFKGQDGVYHLALWLGGLR